MLPASYGDFRVMKKLLLWLLVALLIIGFWVGLYFWLAQPPSAISPPKPPKVSNPINSSSDQPETKPPVFSATPRPVTPEAPLVPLTYALPEKRPAVGINVNELHHEDASFPFIDLFRQADPFANNILELPNADKAQYDAYGWPTQLNGSEVGTKFIGKMPAAALPVGDYIVLYDGQGALSYGHGVELTGQKEGRETIRFTPDEKGEINASLLITATNPADPLRHIRILPPGGICQDNPYQRVANAAACTSGANYLAFETHYNSIVFTPEYLKFLSDFSAIRFMTMSGITRNPIVHWQDRPNMQEATWGGKYGQRGAPLEIQVDLANRMQADAWFNLPHAADDEYVREFAVFVRDHLRPEARIYVEYTNEVWNTAFSHSEYTQKKGIEAGYSINSVEAGYQYYVQRAHEVFTIWENVFGGRERLVRVLGSWDSRPDVTKKLLTDYGGAKIADVLAIAPYFGGNIKGYRESTTVDEIFKLTTDAESFRSLPQILDHIREQAKLAKQAGLKLVAYEGGQGLVDWVTRDPNQHPNPLFFAANRDPRMGELYTQLLEGWKDAGGELFMAFASPRTCQWFGCWGLKEYLLQPPEQAYKYEAVLRFINAHRDWTMNWENKSLAAAPAVLEPVAASKKPRNPADPIIVFRPANDPERYFFLENPQTLDNLLVGESWEKKNLFGKWQGKWDAKFLYVTVRVYDSELKSDSDKPEEDDSVEILIDADNSRLDHYDGRNDFRLVFAWGREQVFIDPKSPQSIHPDLTYQLEKTADGYELKAKIPWAMLGVTPAVGRRVGVEIQVNDDDDGAGRERKVSWLAREDNAMNNPRLFGVVLISGR